MNPITCDIECLDWHRIHLQLSQEGFAVLRDFLGGDEFDERAARKQLPDWMNDLKRGFYPPLAQLANQWHAIRQLTYRFPPQLAEFEAHCLAVGQQHELSHLTCLREAQYLSLGQDADGEYIFPFQLVTVLSCVGKDFTGGEFVLTEQRPRMQSRPMVVPLRRGDLAIITTAQRPFKGNKGYYKVNMKHAISRVKSGERLGFSLGFHFAPGPRHDRTA